MAVEFSFSKYEAWQPAREYYDLTEIVGTVLGRLPEAEARRVQLAVPADLPMVRVDGGQILAEGKQIGFINAERKVAAEDQPMAIQRYCRAGIAGNRRLRVSQLPFFSGLE